MMSEQEYQSILVPPNTQSHRVSSAVSQGKPQNLRATTFLVSNIDPRKPTASTGPTLTPNTNDIPSSAQLLSQNRAEWELLPAQVPTRDVIAPLGDGPGITRSNLGK